MAISSAIDATARAQARGALTRYRNLSGGAIRYLPQRIALIAQGNTAASYATTPVQVYSRRDVGDLVGYGSPAERMAAALFPTNGDGVGNVPVTLYPLVDDGSGVVGTGSIAASGTQTTAASYIIYVNKIRTAAVNIAVSDTADTALGLIKAAINAIPEMPVIAGTVAAGSLPITSKWKGETANDITIEIVGTEYGITFTVTDPTGGANNPDITAATDLINATWETIILPGYNYDDTTTLDALQLWGEGRWNAMVRKPAIALFAYTGTSQATASAVTDARDDDRVNCLVSVPGSDELPIALAARMASRIAVRAQNTPPRDYVGMKLSGYEGGDITDQWTWEVEDDAVKKGLGTTHLDTAGNVIMNDTVTMYHPDGEDPPAYGYVVDIVKLQQIHYNLAAIFEDEAWQGAPLVPDDTETDEPTARKPKDAKAAIFTLIDNLARKAIIVDPDFSKDATLVGINDVNPKRLDVAFTVKLSGNTNIISVDLNFGFYFG